MLLIPIYIFFHVCHIILAHLCIHIMNLCLSSSLIYCDNVYVYRPIHIILFFCNVYDIVSVPSEKNAQITRRGTGLSMTQVKHVLGQVQTCPRAG